MAETLSVTDMLPNKFEPKRKNRWVFAIEGIDAYLIKSTKRPSVKTEEKEIPWINSRRYIAGKTTFETLSVTLYDAIAPSGAQQVMKLLDPVGTVIELWDIKGSFITSANFGELGYDGDDLLEIQLDLRFDNCVLQY